MHIELEEKTVDPCGTPQVKILVERAAQGNHCDLLSSVTGQLVPAQYKADNFCFQEAVGVH